MTADSVAPQPPKVALVRVDDVQFHPSNVRRDLGDLREMVNSITRYGVMQPIVVEAHGRNLRLRAGHRRLAAARIAGLARIPAVVHAQILAEDEWIVQALHENTMRRNLDPAERADAIKRLRDLCWTWTDIADSLAISVTTAQKWAAGQTILTFMSETRHAPVIAAQVRVPPSPPQQRLPAVARKTPLAVGYVPTEHEGDPVSVMPARAPRGERDVRRQAHIDRAVAKARQAGTSIVCRNEPPQHEHCKGETPAPGYGGCLCTCHDDARDAEET